MPDAVAVSLRNVVKRYGTVEAVSGISLEVRRGEFLAIIGPSGCGKTSTLRMIAGLESPTSGDIYIDGQRVNDLKPWKRDTPLVWQNFALFPHMSVAKNVEYGLRMRREPKETRGARVAKVLDTVGLKALADRSVTQLSGGQKQRVGLARALVLNPKVLLLDEPLGALDAKISRSMQGELRRLQRELLITFVYVTHNQSEALAMADRIAVMDAGMIQQVGSPLDVYRMPQNRFVADFVGTNNIFSGHVQGIEDDRLLVTTPQGVFRVPAARRDGAKIGEAVEFVVSADRITTHMEGVAEENAVEGKITAIEVIGSVVSLFLELPDGYELRLQKSEQRVQGVALSIGDTVAASWSTQAAFVLPETTEANGLSG
ncbi:MAG: ABC transporter ATP-binding protein [Thermoleophilia bacterium]